MAEATHELPQGKKVIKIGVQKPRFVFGYAPPDSTIQKWLARGYTHGHVAPGQVLRAFVPISMIVTAIWATGSFLVGKRAGTLSPEWKKASEQYREKQGSQLHFIDHWKKGEPIKVPETGQKF